MWWRRPRKTNARGQLTRAPSCWRKSSFKCNISRSRRVELALTLSLSHIKIWFHNRKYEVEKGGWGRGGPTPTRTPPSPLGTRGRLWGVCPPPTDLRALHPLFLTQGNPPKPTGGTDLDTKETYIARIFDSEIIGTHIIDYKSHFEPCWILVTDIPASYPNSVWDYLGIRTRDWTVIFLFSEPVNAYLHK